MVSFVRFSSNSWVRCCNKFRGNSGVIQGFVNCGVFLFVFLLYPSLSSNDGQSDIDFVRENWLFVNYAKIVKSVRKSTTTEVAIDFSELKRGLTKRLKYEYKESLSVEVEDKQ